MHQPMKQSQEALDCSTLCLDNLGPQIKGRVCTSKYSNHVLRMIQDHAGILSILEFVFNHCSPLGKLNKFPWRLATALFDCTHRAKVIAQSR